MKLKATTVAVSAALSVMPLTQNAGAAPVVKSVEFIGMPAPSSVDERADIYTKARMKVTYVNRKSQTFDLEYHPLMNTTDLVNGNVVGGLFDHNDDAIMDANGQMASDVPGGNSLMDIPGMRAADPSRNRPLAMVTHWNGSLTSYPAFVV